MNFQRALIRFIVSRVFLYGQAPSHNWLRYSSQCPGYRRVTVTPQVNKNTVGAIATVKW